MPLGLRCARNPHPLPAALRVLQVVPFRAEFTRHLEAFCQQPHNRKEDDTCRSATCSCFFENLDEEGKAVFMLGGPVVWGEGSEPWSPEEKVDKAALDFVLKAYKKRSMELKSKFGLVEDLTKPQPHRPSKPKTGRPQSAEITQHFLLTNTRTQTLTLTSLAPFGRFRSGRGVDPIVSCLRKAPEN